MIAELALMPMEGGARVAIVESAQRMNEDAQAALLKTLEEPPAGVTLVLCADAEEPLLPTIRSRCARLRLGPVDTRTVEAILAEHGIADPALAARLARISAGRPGLALAWATRPEALRLRDELTRVLLDLTAARPSERLSTVRSAVARGGVLADLAGGSEAGGAPGGGTSVAASVSAGSVEPPAKSGRRPGAAAASPPGSVVGSEDAQGLVDPAEPEGDGTGPTRTPAAERRRAAEAVIAIWTDVARDLLLTMRGMPAALRDPRALEDTAAAAALLDEDAVLDFLDRLGRATVLLAGNVSPELLLDDLAIAWPQRRSAAA